MQHGDAADGLLMDAGKKRPTTKWLTFRATLAVTREPSTPRPAPGSKPSLLRAALGTYTGSTGVLIAVVAIPVMVVSRGWLLGAFFITSGALGVILGMRHVSRS